MRITEYSELVTMARVHYENLRTDIENAKDRMEHIRLTALAQEAHNLLVELSTFETGLVYSHSAARATEQMFEDFQDRSNQLEFPEFKSPYDPRNN
jgi:hypothetical protein